MTPAPNSPTVEAGEGATSLSAINLHEAGRYLLGTGLQGSVGFEHHGRKCVMVARYADAPETPEQAFLAELLAELIRARTLFPGDRIMTIALAEEFGELAKAILDEPVSATGSASTSARATVVGRRSRSAAWRTRTVAPRSLMHLARSVTSWPATCRHRKSRGSPAWSRTPRPSPTSSLSSSRARQVIG